MANKVMIKDWEEPIKFGWRLATLNEMETNRNVVKRQVEGKGINRIFLSNGSWDFGAGTCGSRHEMKVLLFLKEAPKFKILHRRKDSEEIGQQGWRIACVDEVEEYKDTVQALIRGDDITDVLLSDGWADCHARCSGEEKTSIEYALFIETPVTKRRGKAHDKPSAQQARTGGENSGTKNAGGSLSVKGVETSKKNNAAKESGRNPPK